jgi:hypothetical protein
MVSFGDIKKIDITQDMVQNYGALKKHDIRQARIRNYLDKERDAHY